MELNLISNEELISRAAEFLALPYFRPSHRVVNFFDKAKNRIYLTEFQDFMDSKKEEFGMQTQRSLGIEVVCPGIEDLLPRDLDPAKAITYSVSPNLYFVQVESRFFAIGQRVDNNRMAEERLDGLSLLGEVGVDGEFRFVFLPTIGMCIRGISRYDIRRRQDDFSFMEEEPEARRASYSGIYHLVSAEGVSVMEEFGEDIDLLRKFLGATVGGDEPSAWRLRNWSYPIFWDGDNEPRRRWGKGELIRRAGRFAGPGRVQDVSFEAGTGKVTVKRFEREETVELCTPWLEYSFAETFYGS